MDGYGHIRQAARLGIESAGGEPFLIEDYGAINSSPRNACLDGVGSCDALLLIVGPRGGFIAPSGKLVVEEELDEAIRLVRPILVYIDKTKRDDSAEAFAAKVSKYHSGFHRATFTSADHLQTQIADDLTPVVSELNLPKRNMHQLNQILVKESDRNSGTPHLRVVIAPEREAEMGSFIDLANLKSILGIAHDCDFLSHEYAKTNTEGADSLTIEQHTTVRSSVLDRVILRENATIVFESVLGTRDKKVDWHQGWLSEMVIAGEQVDDRIATACDCTKRLFDRFDAYSRYPQFHYNACLYDYGSVVIERDPKPRNSMQVPGYRTNEPLVAFDQFKIVGRASLDRSSDLAKQTTDKLMRKLRTQNTNSNNF